MTKPQVVSGNVRETVVGGGGVCNYANALTFHKLLLHLGETAHKCEGEGLCVSSVMN